MDYIWDKLKPLFGTLAFLAFLAILGLVGGIDKGLLRLGDGTAYIIMVAAVMFPLLVLAGAFEDYEGE